ncbi:MAG: monovalent cation/H(+) antiporter subunit G [Acholeplasmataceae bacterium]|jgi:multicomponent Na+:H+ antiporter subunit G|nr:monovalent cation/H(+) antiporter subunit G [Acholeplasmataceae bacterium]
MINLTYFILALSWIIIVFGMIAIFRLKNMYSRILAATTIDTVASLLVLIGLMFVADSFNLIIRLILLLIFLLITNPISSHVNIRSAYLMGIPINLKEK